MRTIAPIVESFNVKNYCQSILFGNFIFRMPYKKKLFFVIGATAPWAFVRLVNSASNRRRSALPGVVGTVRGLTATLDKEKPPPGLFRTAACELFGYQVVFGATSS